jgi:hypothetical protein
MSKRRMPSSPGLAKQRGAAFVISIIILIALTLIAVTATNVANSDLVMTNGFENENEAFIGAENSLSVGERVLANQFTGAPTFDFDEKGDGYYSEGGVVIDSVDWDDIVAENGGVSGAEYIVEYLGPAPLAGGSLSVGAGAATSQQFVYRIVGRGTSSKGSVRLTETIFTTTE